MLNPGKVVFQSGRNGLNEDCINIKIKVFKATQNIKCYSIIMIKILLNMLLNKIASIKAVASLHLSIMCNICMSVWECVCDSVCLWGCVCMCGKHLFSPYVYCCLSPTLLSKNHLWTELGNFGSYSIIIIFKKYHFLHVL